MQSSAELKRKRARVACEPCRERKRKCNGANPCVTCSDWGYDCYYQSQRGSASKTASSSKSARLSSTDEAPREYPIQAASQSEVQDIMRSVEANSGAAFVRKMGLRVDPANAPKLNLFGWNVGARQLPSGQGPVCAFPIVDILSRTDMETLANIYFTKVDPCYGFIDSRVFFERLDARWRNPLVTNVYDSVLCGVAALGSLFSERTATITELHLVEAARSILDVRDLCTRPSLDLVTGWTLRVVYMRMTASPYAAWIASSTLLHLIEASGFQLESSYETVLSRNTKCDLDIQRRLVGVAQHLNMWISYDLGLSRVSFHSGLPSLPSPRQGDYTTELLGLLPVSASLGPEKVHNGKELEALLVQTLNRTHTQPPSILAQCNLVLCLLRRLYSSNLNITTIATESVLSLLKKGLCAARTMVMSCCPWHHVANVPFHIICILLEMDTRASFELLPEAMETLKQVTSTYDTNTMREAYSTARLLIFLYQKRRSADAKFLQGLLDKHEERLDPAVSPQQPGSGSEELLWLEGLVADMPSLQGFDLNQFLQFDASPD